MARTLLLWPMRSHARCRSLRPKDARTLDFVGHLRHDPKFSLETRSLSTTDIELGLESFLTDHPTWLDWYRVLFDGNLHSLDWRSGEPRIPLAGVNAWLRLCNEFDACSLLTFHWAKIQRRYSSPADPPDWRTTPVVSDIELRNLWARGLSDMHIHVGGVRLPAETWTDLMERPRISARYKDLARGYRRIGRTLSADLEAAVEARTALCAALDHGGSAYTLSWADKGLWWNWDSARLQPERRLLAAAWRRLLDHEENRDEPGSSRHTEETLGSALDIYLSHKHRFFSVTRQPAFFETPGLRHFDATYFSALKSKNPWDPALDRYGRSPRLSMMVHGNACSYLLESEHLVRMELRFAPLPRAADYLRFFHNWERLAGKLHQARSGKKAQIRFAIHFKRSAAPRSQSQATNTMTRLNELDRETAALRLALRCEGKHGEQLAANLARIDIAGQERDTACDLYRFHMRLLRGDADALRALEENRPPSLMEPHLKVWRRLLDRNAHRPNPMERALGLTIHAGEDYADPLDGLYQIASAVEGFAMGDGDGIGHALALAADITKPTEFHMLEAGASLDSLCWLQQMLQQSEGWAGIELERTRLREQIWRQTRTLYERAREVLPPAANVDDILELWRVRCREIVRDAPLTETQNRMLESERRPDMVKAREQAYVIGHERHFPEALKRAQQLLFEQIVRRRIVIEMNPSSNLRISGSSETEENPTVKLFEATMRGLLACVNTDNPGVFASCIENEYALLLDGARGTLMNEAEIRACLEQVRRTGLELLS